MQFHTPPSHQGQTIEVSYASDGEHIYRRTIDRSGPAGRVERTPYPEAAPRRWRTWWRTPDDRDAVALDGGTYEAATEAQAVAQSEVEARRALAERQLRIMPDVSAEPECRALPEACTVHDDGRYAGEARAFAEWLEEGGCKVALVEGRRTARPGGLWAPEGAPEAPAWAWERYCDEEPPPRVAPFTFEPWNEPPRLDGVEWEPVEAVSDGARWQTGGFERLDLDGYGALAFEGGGFVCLAGVWYRLAVGRADECARRGDCPHVTGYAVEALRHAPIVHARDWPGARAVVGPVRCWLCDELATVPGVDASGCVCSACNGAEVAR